MTIFDDDVAAVVADVFGATLTFGSYSTAGILSVEDVQAVDQQGAPMLVRETTILFRTGQLGTAGPVVGDTVTHNGIDYRVKQVPTLAAGDGLESVIFVARK